MGKYYEYSQNNSGGSFTKPAITVKLLDRKSTRLNSSHRL